VQSFKVKFITPLLIHGSAKGPDAGHLGTSFRGVWRFWFRAFVGGMVPDITMENLLTLENSVFGAANRKVGKIFSMKITPPDNLGEFVSHQIPAGFNEPSTNRPFMFRGYKSDTSFTVNITHRKGIDEETVRALGATIWLWGALGGIGQRSRRGFGSPLLELSSNYKSLFDELTFSDSFQNAEEIKNFLKLGVAKVWDTIEQFLKKTHLYSDGSITIVGKNNMEGSVPCEYGWFVLRSLKQIAIGMNENFVDQQPALKAIHGCKQCTGLGYGERWPSPIITRLYRLTDGHYIPVATHCDQDMDGRTCPVSGHTDRQTCIDKYRQKAKLIWTFNE